MKAAAKPVIDDWETVICLPRWVRSAPEHPLESVAVSFGAALALLDLALRAPRVPVSAALLRERLALEAAAACLKREGRADSASDIRDAICLARAGEALGPAGEMFLLWRSLARVNLHAAGWRKTVLTLPPAPVAEILSEPSFDGSPGAQATQMLAEVLQRLPRQEAAALLLADLALTRAVGWQRPVPLLAAHLTRADLRAIAEGRAIRFCAFSRR